MGPRIGCTRRELIVLLGTWLLLAAYNAPAQTNAGPAPDPKTLTFDVVSIKPNNSGNPGAAWGVSQNRYRARNTPLVRVILQAYLNQLAPSNDRVKNAPAWVMEDRYDITATIDDATAEKWKGLKQAEQVAMAAPMLRAMLEERCKLVVHTEPTEVQGYALVVGKHGIKMKQSQPDEPVPTRAAKFEGGWMMVPIAPGQDAKQSVQYLQITMAQLAAFISLGRDPIEDRTGLTGKYDFELPKLEVSQPGPGDGQPATPSPTDIAHMFDWSAIGLELKPIKVSATNLVIDHIERPSEN